MQLRRLAFHCEPKSPPLARAFSSLAVVDEILKPGLSWPRQTAPAMVFFLTEAGGATACYDRQTMFHRPGAFVVMSKGVAYEERTDRQRPWHARYVMFTGPWEKELTRVLGGRRKAVFVYGAVPPAWERLLREIVELGLDQPACWEWALLGRMALLTGHVAAHPAPSPGPVQLVERVRQLVDRAPLSNWSVKELAAALRVSRSYLEHRFRELSGQPLATWMRRRRVEHARCLLRQGLSVAETAERLGLNNPFHFSRMFKKVTGTPPSSIRPLPSATLHPL